jgi:hypothetical protein
MAKIKNATSYFKVYNQLPARAAYLDAYHAANREHLAACRKKNEQESASLLGMTVRQWRTHREIAREDAAKKGIDKLVLYRQRNLLSITERRVLGEGNA